MTDRPTDTAVVIVGAGQAGLSVGYYLRKLGLDAGNDFILLDRGPGAGGAWQFRWEALRLGYAHRVNDLPGMEELELSFDTADRSAPARDIIADYYRRYVLPWIGRRLTGRSSGDGRVAKIAELTVVDPASAHPL